MLNRHGLVAGATGTGKTKTLQLMAEQLSAQGVPVFLADIKGDLSGVSQPGQPSDKLTQRTQSIGQAWQAGGYPVEYLALGGLGTGVPVRATVTSFGPVLLAKVLDLPEAGDLDKPKLVFFFDEAHLLFRDASKAFLDQITTTVRLIRSKGVGVFFVTQSPKDVDPDVLAQLGNRVQHALRAYTPDDAKALRAAVSTFPKSAYDLEELLTTLGIGEAVVTVLSETGAPTPVAWTRLRPPQSLMAAIDPAQLQQMVNSSPLQAKYATRTNDESAAEKLAARTTAMQQAA